MSCMWAKVGPLFHASDSKNGKFLHFALPNSHKERRRMDRFQNEILLKLSVLSFRYDSSGLCWQSLRIPAYYLLRGATIDYTPKNADIKRPDWNSFWRGTGLHNNHRTRNLVWASCTIDQTGFSTSTTPRCYKVQDSQLVGYPHHWGRSLQPEMYGPGKSPWRKMTRRCLTSSRPRRRGKCPDWSLLRLRTFAAERPWRPWDHALITSKITWLTR